MDRGRRFSGYESAALAAGKNTIGVLLTGMGKDGAAGLKAIKDAGGLTIAQDERTSVVWGMPGAAIKLGAANFIVPIDEMAFTIMQCVDKIMHNER